MAAELSPGVRYQLDKIEPSVEMYGTRLYPCSAQLHDGRMLECVYFVDIASFKRFWGWERPEEVPGGKLSISPDQVASVQESRLRLPARFANQIYRAGESGMGYFNFCLVFSWWYRRDYVVGSFVDFLEYPFWFGPADVRRVILYRNKREARRTPETWWCVLGK
jgi:hypothetical protein